MSCDNRNAVNVCWIGGDTESYTIRYKDSEGQPIDITGATADMEVKKSTYDDSPVIPATNAVITGADGLIEFSFSPSETLTLLGTEQLARFVYDTQLTLDDGTVKTLTGGELNVHRGITD